MNKTFIGIDAGMSGAIAILHSEYDTVFPIPFTQEENIDAFKIIGDVPFDMPLGDFEHTVFACIEKVWRPSKLVRIAGILEGIMLSLDIPVFRVAPSTWRKEVLGNKLATKDDALKFCQENFNEISLLRTKRSRVPDHNFAEAICLAEYAKRKHFVPEDQR